jgi:pilus assembly protein Flp/PilA
MCNVGVVAMSHAANLLRRLDKDDEGAALIEYTVLIGILLIAVIATIGLVGTWINNQWANLAASLP